MPEVSAAFGAQYLRSDHSTTDVTYFCYGPFSNLFIKAGPPTMGIKF